MKREKGKKFSYKDIKKVYSIIFYEESPKELKEYPTEYIHRSRQQMNTGAKMELLQEFVFIPLDFAKRIYQNKGVRNKLEAWLVFLSSDDPDVIVRLLEDYPQFYKMYEEVYNICLNTERVMELFSKELYELDKNTVQYMIDEMQDEIDAQKADLQRKDAQLQDKDAQLQDLNKQIQELRQQLLDLQKLN